MSDKKRITIVACEGQHDVAFITRILHVAGYITSKKKISTFPSPFDSLFKNIATSMVIADRKLGYQSPNYLLPSSALEKEDEVIFIHSLNGDGRGEERCILINQYSDLIGEDDFTKDLEYYFRFLFFFDADSDGVDERLKCIVKEFNLSSPLSNGIISTYSNNEIGCYVYHENGKHTGVLEDILLEHFSKKNTDLFDNISGFLSSNALETDRTKELHLNGDNEIRKGPSKYYLKKSQVSLFGQLQFSGMNNSVIISRSDFLRKADIDNCAQCILIKNMFIS